MAIVACSGDAGSTAPPATCAVTAVALGNVPNSLGVGQQATLTASATATNCSQADLTPVWSSGSANVAAVSASGVVSGVAPGTAVISANIHGVSSSAQVTVVAIALNIAGTFYHDRTGPNFSANLKGSINLVRDVSCDDAPFECYSGVPVLDVPNGQQTKWIFGVDKDNNLVVCTGSCGALACVGTINAAQDMTASCYFLQSTFVGTFRASRTRF